MSTILLSVACLIIFLQPNCYASAGSTSAWTIDSQLERESAPAVSFNNYQQHNQRLASPVQVGLSKYASPIFNGRPVFVVSLDNNNNNQQQQQSDWFQCIEPSKNLFENFVKQYNRTFESSEDKLERLNLFATTLRRTIMLNRIVQNEILNLTNYEVKPEIRNYHFISPLGQETNIALWYSDITDCELGLIKYILFDIFYLIDKNDLASAYKKALDNSEHLPLLNDDGFEQLANILLVRLYDRFKGDEKMNQLFQWPNYLKKLASFAYNRRQVSQLDFKLKLPLITFAYPAYFKDLKYNLPAVNRTGDNLKVHNDHERFNKIFNRKFTSRQEKNKRLAIFRQRLSHLDLLNEDDVNKWKNKTFQPEWLKAVQIDGSTEIKSEKLISGEAIDGGAQQAANNKHKLSQFSDLTDEEFVAFLSNDFSIIDNQKEASDFLDNNFPIRPLDDKYRAELAQELEIRRTILDLRDNNEQQISPYDNNNNNNNNENKNKQVRKTLTLARRVIDDLISDVGLPIGSVMLDGISEEEHYSVFNKINQFFGKTFVRPAASGGSSQQQTSGRILQRLRLQQQQQVDQLNDSDLADERQRRYEQFKLNYGRFKAWFIKEGWQLSESQLIAMLRLSDLSWQEIKVTLFRVCCLTEDSLQTLSSTNATIQYLGSNEFFCQQMGNDLPDSILFQQQQQQTSTNQIDHQQLAELEERRELAALELYYYYCVHFNKHHNDIDSFNKRFAIFRYNIDHIRRHSCTRGITLFRSLNLKLSDTLSTIDVLDPRRSYTDDLNLDRFKYFTVQNVNNQQQQQQADQDDQIEFARFQTANENNDAYYTTVNNRDESSGSSRSRAGISYRREPFFSSLIQNNRFQHVKEQQLKLANKLSYADRLTNAAQNGNLYSQKYRQNSINRIYDLVMQRYRLCLRTVGGSEPSDLYRQQQCQASGPLADKAIGSSALGWNDNQFGQLQLEQKDKCAFYRLGLEPWAEGLTKQDLFSAQLIQIAKC